jgi:hypothetical protein
VIIAIIAIIAALFMYCLLLLRQPILFSIDCLIVSIFLLCQADFNRRWARLDGAVLKVAYERELDLTMMKEDGVVNPVVPRLASAAAAEAEAEAEGGGGESQTSFTKLPFPIRQLPRLDPEAVTCFEAAREVFLRAAGRLEVAKRDFPMDGNGDAPFILWAIVLSNTLVLVTLF